MATVPAVIESPPEVRSETVSGMATSLMFWLCLLVSTTLFAAVSLAPKYLEYLQLRDQFDRNQNRLVALEQQAEQLERIVAAIRDDADFAAELTRIEFDAVGPDEEVIPVDGSLKYDARSIPLPDAEPAAVTQTYEPLVRYLASEKPVRHGLLAVAALLVIISFAMLPPAGARKLDQSSRTKYSLWQVFQNRYIRQGQPR